MTSLLSLKLICSALATFVTVSGSNLDGETKIKALSNDDETYVSDIVGYAPGEDGYSEAKLNEYLNNGYIKADNNLNEGVGVSIPNLNCGVYLLYKTTKNKNEAIRKVSTMHMDGGYYDWDYASFIEGYQANIDQSINEFKEAALFYAERLKGNNKAALIAKDLMDLYYVPKETSDDYGTPLGEWLTNSNTYEEYKKVLLYSNSLISANMVSALTLASIDVDETSWLDRFVEELSNPICDVTNADNESDYAEFVSTYGASLEVIHGNIEDYYNNYLAAAERLEKNGKLNVKNTNSSFDDSIDKMIDSLDEEADEESQDVMYLECNALLEKYSVTSVGGQATSCTLSDIIKEIGTNELDQVSGYLYGLVKALNAGQYYGLKNCGLGNLLLYSSLSIKNDNDLTGVDKETLEKYGNLDGIKTKVNDAKDYMKTKIDKDCVSIYISTNTDLLDKECAMTSQASRNNAALGEFDELVAEDAFGQTLIDVLVYCGFIAGICAGVALASFGAGMLMFWGASFWEVITLGIGVFQGWVSVTCTTFFGGVVGVVGLIGIGICAIVAVIIGIIMLVRYLQSEYEKYNAPYTSIPEVLIDYAEVDGQAIYSRYDAVYDISTNKPLNLNFTQYVNAYELRTVFSSKWQALYFTRDDSLGAPLVVRNNKFMITSTTHSDESYSGMSAVCDFGSIAATDLNTYISTTNKSSLYMFYYVEGAVVDETTNKNGEFISSVILKCSKNAVAAKRAVTNEDHILIDRNLSPSNDYATYIGFQTTDNASQAITDIRVSWNDTSEMIYWGDLDNTYGFAGSTMLNEDGTTFNTNGCHISLYYSKKPGVGSPILSHCNVDKDSAPDGFGIITTEANFIPDGMEGINYFSGGRAADFNFFNMIPTTKWDDQKSFLYFKPKEQYTSDNGKVYCSGLGIISGQDKTKGHPLGDLNNATGLDYDRVGYTRENLFDSINNGLVLCKLANNLKVEATYTYNPKRAITDIGIFTGQEDCPMMAHNLIARDQGYCAVNIYTQGDDSYYQTTDINRWRVIRDSHTYINNHNSDLKEGVTGNSQWVFFPKAMYVAGPSAGRKEIELGDIKCFSDEKDMPDGGVGYASVHELKETYYDSSDENGNSVAKFFDIGTFRQILKEGHFCMVYKQKARIKPKYVEKVYACQDGTESQSYNICMSTLMSKGCDHIFEDHLVAKLNSDSSPFEYQIYFHITDNITLYQDAYPYEDWDHSHLKDHQDGLAFIGVRYTNKKKDALSDIRVYSETRDQYLARGDNPSDSMDFVIDEDGTKRSFSRATDLITGETNRYMWIYTSDAGSVKITDVQVSAFETYSVSDEDISSHELHFGNRIVTDQNLSLDGVYHLYMTYTTADPSYVKDIYYSNVTKDGISDAVNQMRVKSCIDFKIYQTSDTNYLVIGYSRTATRGQAIKDVRITTNTDYLTKFGNTQYLEANLITSQYNTDNSLVIYYTKGTSKDDQYAIKDFAFVSARYADDDKQFSTNGLFVVDFEGKTDNGEMIYDLGVTEEEINMASAYGFLFETTSGNYAIYEIRNSNVEWGILGVNNATASIFDENPSLGLLLLFIGLTVGAGVVVKLVTYLKDKKNKA